MRALFIMGTCLFGACSAPIDTPDPVVMDGKGHGRLLAISLTPPSIELEVGESVDFLARAIFEDGFEADITTSVAWESSANEIIEPERHGRFIARGRGTALVSAVVSSVRGAAAVDVSPPMPQEILIPYAAEPLAVGDTQHLVAIASWGDDTEDVTEAADWDSSAPEIVSVTGGRITALATGAATIRATYREVTGAIDLTIQACHYPLDDGDFTMNAVIPAAAWDGAYLPDCSPTRFDLEELFCDTESDISTIAFVVEPTTAYIQELGRIAANLQRNGGLIVWLETTTATGGEASNDWAHTRIDDVIGGGPGIRAGDLHTAPAANLFRDSGTSSFVVRRRDMRVIAKQSAANQTLPYIAIALDPDADWSAPDQLDFRPNCGPADEEPSEPNDEMDTAQIIGFETVEGGICADAPDFFRVDVEGDWRMVLEFSHAVGDLDMHLWNTATNQARRQNGNYVGARSGTDNEIYDGSGPTTFRIIGYQSASSAYQMTISPR